MKKPFCLFACLWYAVCSGQTSDKLSVIKAPTSPSSVVIGSQPGTIARPKSWEAVEAAVFSNYTSNNQFFVPNDFSLEITPYWLNTKAKIPMEDFLSSDVGANLMRNLSISVSSTKSFLVNDTIKTDAMGFGFRTMIIQGTDKLGKLKVSRDLADLSQSIFAHGLKLEGKFNSKQQYIELLMDEVKSDPEITKKLPQDKQAQTRWYSSLKKSLTAELTNDVSKIIEATSDAVDKFLKLDEAIQDILQNGFRLEFAGAMALNFPTNATDFSYVPKYGFWVTPSYSMNAFEVLFVFRYFWYNADYYKAYQSTEGFYDQSIDYGGRLVYKKDRFSVEGEVIGRRSTTIVSKSIDASGFKTVTSKSESDFQYTLNFNYRLSDSIVLSYNFGKKFSASSGTQNTLVSTATLNFGIGGPVIKNLK